MEDITGIFVGGGNYDYGPYIRRHFISVKCLGWVNNIVDV